MLSGSISLTAAFNTPLGVLSQLAGSSFKKACYNFLLLCCIPLFYSPYFCPHSYSPTTLGTLAYTYMYVNMFMHASLCVYLCGNTQGTSLPAFPHFSASTAAATLPLSLIFVSTLVQGVLPTCFHLKGYQWILRYKCKLLLQKAAALCFIVIKSLLSWVSNWELR